MKENTIHQGFEHWMRAQGIIFITCRMDRAATIARGMPDYCVTMANRALYLEVKTEKGKLSEHQKARIEEIRRKAGMVVHICRSVEECVRVVTAWLGVDPSEPVKVATATASEQPEPFAKDFSEQFANLKASIPTPAAGNEFVGTWSGQPWVFRSRDDGRADLVRRATPADIINLKSAA